jgi:aryl-alcohol dehydrogenase-like predicted oxidoreductase
MAMERRRLGKTGHESTVITFGTYAIGNVSQAEADRAIEFALEHGINHFDVAPTYAEAELRLGDYLKRHPQPDLFIGCKTNKRSFDEASMELHRTLDRLGRDEFDLYQLHAVCNMDDLDTCFAPGGSMEAILAAKDEGLVDHIGITGHGMKAPATHLASLDRYPFATVMTSNNPVMEAIEDVRRDWRALLTRCEEDDVGVHVLKATAKAPWGDRKPTHNTWYEPLTDQDDIDRAVAWALARRVTTLCSSGDVTVFPTIVAAAERYRQVDVQERDALLAAVPEYENIFAPATA